jgi:hypothetical protein
MRGGTWFQTDLNDDSKLQSCFPAFKVYCLFSRVKETIQENNRKLVYSLERILLNLIPLHHCLLIYMKAELPPDKPWEA